MILIVDDHLDTAKLLARMLKLRGHDVMAAGSGSEGLSLLNSMDPALVILDKCMPGMDGLAVLRQIRAATASHDTPVIFYSADANADDVEEAKRLGAQDYLVKGFTPWEDICTTVDRYV